MAMGLVNDEDINRELKAEVDEIATREATAGSLDLAAPAATVVSLDVATLARPLHETFALNIAAVSRVVGRN